MSLDVILCKGNKSSFRSLALRARSLALRARTIALRAQSHATRSKARLVSKSTSGTPFVVGKEAYNEYDPFALACLILAELELIPEPLRKMAIYSKSKRKSYTLEDVRGSQIGRMRQNSVFFKQGAILPSGVWQDIAD